MPTADEFQKVTDRLYFWQVYDPAVKADLSCCARRGPGGLIFIDPIPLEEASLESLVAESAPLGIVLTSGNHARAAEAYRSRFSIPVYAHLAAEPHLGLCIDQRVAENDRLFDALTVIELPGAAPGEIALYDESTLHVGDALIHLPPHGLAILPEKYCSDPRELRVAMQKLLRFRFQILTFAHGFPIVNQASSRLAQLFP